VSFIGEGAVNKGAFHESLNLAAVWNLPVIFVVEDNAWGISVSKKDSTAVARNDVRVSRHDAALRASLALRSPTGSN